MEIEGIEITEVFEWLGIYFVSEADASFVYAVKKEFHCTVL